MSGTYWFIWTRIKSNIANIAGKIVRSAPSSIESIKVAILQMSCFHFDQKDNLKDFSIREIFAGP